MKTFFVSALFWIPLQSFFSGLAFSLAAAAYLYTLEDPTTGQFITGWIFIGVYAVIGLVAGGITGFLSAAIRTVKSFERSLQEWVQRQPAPKPEEEVPATPLDQLQGRYETILDQYLNQTVGRIPLPGFLDRFIREKLREAIVADFIADCERRGLTTADAGEFRRWLGARGIGLGMELIYSQFQWWQWIVYTLLALLGGGALVWAYFNG